MPGFYTADGRSAHTGAAAGNVWPVRIAPHPPGEWTNTADLRFGPRFAIDEDPGTGGPVPLEVPAGSFRAMEVQVGDREQDFRRLERVTVRDGYLFVEGAGKYWLKSGCDSPENALAFENFDQT